MKLLLSVAVLLLVSCHAAFGDANDEREFAKLIEELNGALVKADMPVLERMLHKDFVLTNSQGVDDRAAYLDKRKTGRVKYESKSTDELKVRRYQDCAIVTGRDTGKGTDLKGKFDGQAHWTRVFLRQDGRWQLVAAQFSEVEKP